MTNKNNTYYTTLKKFIEAYIGVSDEDDMFLDVVVECCILDLFGFDRVIDFYNTYQTHKEDTISFTKIGNSKGGTIIIVKIDNSNYEIEVTDYELFLKDLNLI